MIILPRKPDSLKDRHLPNAIAVQCDCGVTMLWPKGAGNTVRCPDCKAVETLEVDGVSTQTPNDPHNEDQKTDG